MAKKAFLTVGETYRKVKKKYLTSNGVYRRVKKVYETVNGVYVLRWMSGDVWKKYTCSREYVKGRYVRDDYLVGYTYTSSGYYGKPVNLNSYKSYNFSPDDGFSGTSPGGLYKVSTTQVFYADSITVNQDKTTDTDIYLDITWIGVGSATYQPSYYSYTVGDYIGDVIAESGQLPTTATPELTGDNGNRIYVQENNACYCYIKVVEKEPVVAVLDEAILDASILS